MVDGTCAALLSESAVSTFKIEIKNFKKICNEVEFHRTN